MSTFLLPTTPINGHVRPMLAIGRRLAARGHRVTVLTGRRYLGAVAASGLDFHPLPAEIDYDDANLDAWLPDRMHRGGIAAGRHDIIELFIRPLVAQYRAVEAALADNTFDAVIAEAAFLGVLPLLLGRPASLRLPIVGVSATPLTLRSIDCAPFGSGLPPGRSAFTRMRNAQIDYLLHHGPLRPVQQALDAALVSLGLDRGMINYFDHVAAFDIAFQLGVRGFEYPRREMPESVRFVGPLWSDPPHPSPPDPGWLVELDGTRPVVHVTQGTMANVDPGQLLVPTIKALARENAWVVASTGGRPLDAVRERLGGRLPDNVRLTEFVPYRRLLPRTDVMVTNGGYGGVLRALAHGLPLVVAGRTEDKPEVAGRVAWSGAGLNLRTGRPSPGRIRRAVREVLDDPRYRLAAGRLQTEIQEQHDPATLIAETVEAMTSRPVASP
jgi:MGT family glycosyltransferase